MKEVRSWRTLAKQLVYAYDQDDMTNKFFPNSINLDDSQHQHGSDENCLKAVVEKFFLGGGRYRPSWRAVIWSLYQAHEIHLANQIRIYAEPVQGMCMCVYIPMPTRGHMCCT